MFFRNSAAHVRRTEIFKDTELWYVTDETLIDAVRNSIDHTKIYFDGDTPTLPDKKFERTQVVVNRQRSFEAARNAHIDSPSARIGVLNFASATTPGGGVKNGAAAQEECLCRCSTLYPALVTEYARKNFYSPHRRQKNPLHNDDCIYTPDVLVIKSDVAEPERLDRSEWLTVDVITCAAPKLRTVDIDDAQQLELHVKRGRQILAVAAVNNIDVMILGAFGCGAFMNDPNIVAAAYRKILPEFDGIFERIVFAVYCSPRSDKNFVAFNDILNN